VHKKLYVFGLVHEKIIASKRVFGNPGTTETGSAGFSGTT
jgi:hypothetical protein